MLAEEFTVIESDSPFWLSSSSLLDIVKRFNEQDEAYSWNGWNKQQIRDFLQSLPSRSSIVVGVWETISENEDIAESEEMVIGLICEVIDGEVYSIRTFDALSAVGLKPSNQLEPGFDDAREIILHTEKLVAPVAWALFTEKTTWDELLFSNIYNGSVIDKAQQLAVMTNQGRCVIMGSKTKYH